MGEADCIMVAVILQLWVLKRHCSKRHGKSPPHKCWKKTGSCLRTLHHSNEIKWCAMWDGNRKIILYEKMKKMKSYMKTSNHFQLVPDNLSHLNNNHVRAILDQTRRVECYSSSNINIFLWCRKYKLNAKNTCATSMKSLSLKTQPYT